MPAKWKKLPELNDIQKMDLKLWKLVGTGKKEMIYETYYQLLRIKDYRNGTSGD